MKREVQESVCPNAKPYQSGLHRDRRPPVATSLILVLLIFGVVPLTNYVNVRATRAKVKVSAFSLTPPPPPPLPKDPPPPPEKAKVERPELENVPPPLTLTQIEFILNPGTGSATGDFGIPQQVLDVDALNELQSFDLAELDKRPVPIRRVKPVYPFDAQKSGIEGWVRLIFIVDEDGSTRDIQVAASSAYDFERSAIEALRLWKFEPGMRNGRMVRTRVLIPFHFRFDR